jgi:hypothetical protein
VLTENGQTIRQRSGNGILRVDPALEPSSPSSSQ